MRERRCWGLPGIAVLSRNEALEDTVKRQVHSQRVGRMLDLIQYLPCCNLLLARSSVAICSWLCLLSLQAELPFCTGDIITVFGEIDEDGFYYVSF